jgi:amidase
LCVWLKDILRLIDAEATQGFNDTYFAALAFDKEIGSTRGIDAALVQHELDALVLPSFNLGITPRLAGESFIYHQSRGGV